MLKYFAGDHCLLVWLVLLSCEINLTLERVVFSDIFSEAWDQNTLCCLSEKGYYSIVRIGSVRYVQTEDCNTCLHETLSIWQLSFISLSFWYKLLYCLWIILSILVIKNRYINFLCLQDICSCNCSRVFNG